MDDRTPQIWLIGIFQVVPVQISAETIIQLHIYGRCSCFNWPKLRIKKHKASKVGSYKLNSLHSEFINHINQSQSKVQGKTSF